MSDLESLYKEVILDHYRNPHHRGELPSPPATRAEGYNPLCGDEVTVYIDVEDGVLRDVRLGARGCSISVASASMMTDAVTGKGVDEVREVARRFHDMMQAHAGDLNAGEEVDPATIGAEMGDLEALKGVVKFPVRIKCATLAWVTLEQGLIEAETGEHAAATTEESGDYPTGPGG